jgi:hypothetical protein
MHLAGNMFARVTKITLTPLRDPWPSIAKCKDKYFFEIFSRGHELFQMTRVLIVHSKITFSIARNVIMIGLLSKREDDVISSSRLVYV